MKNFTSAFSIYLFVLVLAGLGGAPGVARATNRTVTSPADGGAGTLRQVILDSAANDTIDFAISGTITLTTGELFVGRNLTVNGPGAANVTVSGNNASRVFEISSNATVNISNLTLSNGRYVGSNGISSAAGSGGAGGPGAGGGLLNHGNLTLAGCVVRNNFAGGGDGGVGGASEIANPGGDGSGGGICNQGILAMNACTVRNNAVSGGNGSSAKGAITSSNGGKGAGGGIYNQGTLTLAGCTLATNQANGGSGGALSAPDSGFGGTGGQGAGGGVYNQGVSSLADCTLAANSTTGGFGASETGSGNHGAPGGDGVGAGIWNNQNTFTLTSCTLRGNASQGGAAGSSNGYPGGPGGTAAGGGIYDSGGGNYLNVVIANNTLAGGTGGLGVTVGPPGSTTGWDVNGAISSNGHNLVGATNASTGWVVSDLTGTVAAPLNSALGPLQDNGGPTYTMAPAAGSAALDGGDDAVLNPPYSLSADQRGYPRKRGAHVDIGAYELYAPETIVVTNNNNSGPGSLRQAIQLAATFGGDTVAFAANVVGTITLTSGELLVDRYVNITGPTAAGLTISGNHASRVFHFTAGGGANTMKISNLTVANGNTGGAGGGIFNETGTGLVLNDCTISGNTSGDSGGGIGNNGLITLSNCTVSGNQAVAGGGLYNYCGTLNVWCCTIASNSAPTGGGFYDYPTVCSFAELNGSLIADNNASSTGPDVLGSFASSGYNLIGKTNGLTGGLGGINQSGSIASPLDPHLGPLQNNGGGAFTHALLAGSPAIDKGISFGLATDQRGRARPFDFTGVANAADGSDVGAFEAGSPLLNIRRAGSAVVVTWPASDNSYALQVRTNLVSPTNWAMVLPLPVILNGENTVTNPIAGPQKFYRLSQ